MINALVLLALCIIRNAGVVGSNPIGGTIYADVFFLKSGGVIGHAIHSVMRVFIPLEKRLTYLLNQALTAPSAGLFLMV